jgi:hypothetical protein
MAKPGPKTKPERGEPVTVADEPKPSKMGRPTKYDPVLREKVIDLGKEGKSKAQIAAALEIARNTLDNWAEAHPDFLSALKEAHDLALAWWEDKGQAGIDAGAGNFNATAFIFQVKNRFRAEYRDQQDHNHGVSDELGDLLARIDAAPRKLPTG